MTGDEDRDEAILRWLQDPEGRRFAKRRLDEAHEEIIEGLRLLGVEGDALRKADESCRNAMNDFKLLIASIGETTELILEQCPDYFDRHPNLFDHESGDDV